MPRIEHILILLTCLGSSMQARAQTKTESAGHAMLVAAASPVNVGKSIIPLNGPWKFRVGDSPIDPGTGAPVWAASTFDDSSWETVDLAPPARSNDAATGASGYVPGWEAHGHPGYAGYAWYRIQVRMTAYEGVPLAVQGPTDFEDAYQFFQNGVLVGSFGKFHPDGSAPAYSTAQGKVFDLPYKEAFVRTSATPTTFAFRVWMDQGSIGPRNGGFHSPPLIGEATTIHSLNRLARLESFRLGLGTFVLVIGYVLLAIVAFSVSLVDRNEPVYRWLVSVFLVLVLGTGATMVAWWTQLLPQKVDNFLIMVGFYPLWLFTWMMVWLFWFRPRDLPWLRSAILWVSLLFMLCNGIRFLDLYREVSHTVAIPVQFFSLLLRAIALLLLIVIVVRGKKPEGFERWLLFPALLSTVLGTFATDLYLAGIPEFLDFHGSRIYLVEATNGVAVVAMMVLIIRRLLFSLHNQRAMAMDVKQAQEVQRVLLPELVDVPGLKIEVEYRPAREVGGDFFQIIPNETDGSVLIVAGDVTGKGLPAGMLVAVLVGAIRSTGETTSDPRPVLEALNRRLLGRSEAFATCLALRIETEGINAGQVTLANAGHLPPYLNGIEVPMNGALPLGMVPDPDFPVSTFRVGSGETLTIISDGILEAENKAHELFGFDRVREMMRHGATAMALANAAQDFGQNDDISAISVTRAHIASASRA